MADSQGTHATGMKDLNFRVLHTLYSVSNGNPIVFVYFDHLYDQLGDNTEDQEARIRDALDYLNDTRFVGSKALGTVSITYKGIKEYEEAILDPTGHTAHFALDVVKETATQLRKDETTTVRAKRLAFLREAHKLSGGNARQPVNAFDVGGKLGYDKDLVQRIYFCCHDGGFIRPFTTGGKFTLTPMGIEQVQRNQPF